MSMNFAREQALLRQRLQAVSSPARAALQQQESGSGTVFLGADAAEVQRAASDLAAAHPQMGRAQMTAFVRKLWQSRIHELRAVGIELLAARRELLEPADFPFLESLLRDCDADPLAATLASEVMGTLVRDHKKLWKDLKRFAAASDLVLRRAAVRASRQSVTEGPESLARFAALAEPLFADADAGLQRALDELLAAAAAVHADAARELAAQHGRTIVLPKRSPKQKPKEPAAGATPIAELRRPAETPRRAPPGRATAVAAKPARASSGRKVDAKPAGKHATGRRRG